MPSYESLMAIKVTDLRNELASRGLPTEGLKKDLAFRLAMSENPPHPTIALPSATSNKEVKLVKMNAGNVPTHEVKRRDPKRSYYHGDKDRPIRSVTRISTRFNNALLSILLISLLSCTLWYSLPTVDKEYLTMRIDDHHDFLSSKISICQDFMSSKLKDGYRSICRGVQPVGGLHEAGEKPRLSVADLLLNGQ